MEFASESRHKGRGRVRERDGGEKTRGGGAVQMVGGSFLYFSRFWVIFFGPK